MVSTCLTLSVLLNDYINLIYCNLSSVLVCTACVGPDLKLSTCLCVCLGGGGTKVGLSVICKLSRWRRRETSLNRFRPTFLEGVTHVDHFFSRRPHFWPKTSSQLVFIITHLTARWDIVFWKFGARLHAFISPKTLDDLSYFNLAFQLQQRDCCKHCSAEACTISSCTASPSFVPLHKDWNRHLILHWKEDSVYLFCQGPLSTHCAYLLARNEQPGAEKAPGRRWSSGSGSEWMLQQWTLYSVHRMIEITIIISGRHRLF